MQQNYATERATVCLPTICLYYKKISTITKLRDLMETELESRNLAEIGKCADEPGFISGEARAGNASFLSYVNAFLAY